MLLRFSQEDEEKGDISMGMTGIDEFLPDNLKIDFDSMCNGCPYIDVSSDSIVLYSDDSYQRVEAKVSCNHINACRWAYTKGLKDG